MDSPRAPLVLTMPAAQQARWRDALQALGVTCLSLPLIDIAPGPDASAPQRAVDALARADLALFVSPSAVAALDACDPWPRWPSNRIAACVGPGTAEALRRRGVATVLSPGADSPQFDSEALWSLLQARGPWRGRQVLLMRGEGGRDWLGERLQAEGARLNDFVLYRRQAPRPEAATLAVLDDWRARGLAPVWLLSSSQALGFGRELGLLPPGSPALATHPRIVAAAEAAGLQVRAVRSEAAAIAAAWRSLDPRAP